MFGRSKTKRGAQAAEFTPSTGFSEKLRGLMIGLNAQGSRREEMADVRRLGLSLAGIARRPGRLADALKGLAETESAHHAETGSWLTAAQVRDGASGPFEACSLLSWIAIAEAAGVPAVPARLILKLTDAESEAAAGLLALPTGAIPDRIRARLRQGVADDAGLAAMLAAGPADPGAPVDMELLIEKLHACMDDVPEGWMVRTDQTGPSTLKALAGTGLVEETAPEVRFGPDLEIGPGWIRNGNRRRVDSVDRRLMKSYVAGRHDGMAYVARPWVKASRYVAGRDPHRAGTPIDVPGKWPAEWRAFVVDGVVTGISSYYAWTEQATPATAATALEVRRLAQRMVDAAIAQRLEPRYAEIEGARANPALAETLAAAGFGPGTFCCTIDFIETDGGITMLEAGPGASPVGGGHPCGFAGVSGKPVIGKPMETSGVAFRHMAHVLIGEPSTWSDGDRTGCILDWNDVAALAATI